MQNRIQELRKAVEGAISAAGADAPLSQAAPDSSPT